MASPRVVCFINQKGGCGKSSLCFHLAGAFAECGQRVLLIDTDPQGSLGRGFLGTDFVEQLSPEACLTSVLSGADTGELLSLVIPTRLSQVSIVGANHTLAPLNEPRPELSGMRQFAVRSLAEQATDFDVVLIDCPPNLYQCTWNALVAADAVVIPVPPEDFGTQGLPAVHQAIEQAQRLNPGLRLLGHVVTRHDRRLLIHGAYPQKLRDVYGTAVFDTVVPEASAFKVAVASRQPVTHWAPRSRAAQLTRELCREMYERMESSQQQHCVA